MTSEHLVLLGPQRLAPTLNVAIESLGARGAIAAVTAGWEERENEDRELSDHLGGRVQNLRIWERCEAIYRRDPDLFQAVRDRRDYMRRVQELYRIRLAHALDAARALLAREGEDELLEEERTEAIADIRRIDAEHFERARAVHADFEASWRPREREAVAEERAELARLLEHCGALCVAGGNVRILLSRLRLLDLLGLCSGRPIVAWSAGAMVLGQRIVLFHDSPPQGAGNAEIFEPGLALYEGLVPLPHARRRLQLGDQVRVRLFAQRFGPDLCVALDERTRVDRVGGRWRGGAGTLRLDPSGRMVEVGAA